MPTLLEAHLKCRTRNLNELLSYSRQAIIDCTERSEDEREQAERTLTTIRLFLSDYERDNPGHATEIQQWWKEVLQPLIPNDAQHLQIDTAKEAQTRLARYEARFQDAWGLPSSEILGSQYTPSSGFNKKTMQILTQFSERSSCEDGQAALGEALRLRLHTDDVRPYRSREPHLVPGDVKHAEELYESNRHRAIEKEHVTSRSKRKRVAEEDRAFSVDYQAPNSKQRCVGQSILNTTASTGDGMNTEIGAEEAIGRDVELQREGLNNVLGSDTPYHEQSSKGPQAPPYDVNGSPSIEIGRGVRLSLGPNQRESLDGSSMSDFYLPEDTEGSLGIRSPMSASRATESPQQLLNPHKLPTTNLAGALSTLEPGKWLSASAVELVLSICCPENARIIDSACFNLGTNNPTCSNLRPCGDHVASVVLPIHHDNHWTLAILNRQARTITHYNSLPTKSTFKEALDKVLSIFMSKIAGDATYPTVAYEELCFQKNSYDCGVHILTTALHAFVDHAPLTFVDSKLWRLIFRALLTGILQTESHLESLMDTSKDIDGEILETNLESHKARLTISRLSVACAESALDVLNQISNRIVISTLSWSQLPSACRRFLSSVEGGLAELSPYSHVFESLPNLDQLQLHLQAGLSKADKLRKASLMAEKSLRAAIGSVQKEKDIRTGDNRRLSVWMKEIADAKWNKGQEQLAAAEAEIEASKQLHQLLCEE